MYREITRRDPTRRAARNISKRFCFAPQTRFPILLFSFYQIKQILSSFYFYSQKKIQKFLKHTSLGFDTAMKQPIRLFSRDNHRREFGSIAVLLETAREEFIRRGWRCASSNPFRRFRNPGTTAGYTRAHVTPGAPTTPKNQISLPPPQHPAFPRPVSRPQQVPVCLAPERASKLSRLFRRTGVKNGFERRRQWRHRAHRR